jgi:hypothetical protein
LDIKEAAVFLLAIYEAITTGYCSTRPVDDDVMYSRFIFQALMQPQAEGGSFSQRGFLLSFKWVWLA